MNLKKNILDIKLMTLQIQSNKIIMARHLSLSLSLGDGTSSLSRGWHIVLTAAVVGQIRKIDNNK